MQFSVFDLKVREIALEGGPNNVFNQSIIDLAKPVIGPDSVIDIFLTLNTPINDALSFIGPGQDFILQIGANEYSIQTDATGEQNFIEIDTDNFALLSADDYLTISIFLNNDAANVLWAFDFLSFDLIVDSNNDNGFSEPDGSKAESENELAINDPKNPGKIIFEIVSDSDKQNNDDELPDFADYIIPANAVVKTTFTSLVLDVGQTVNDKTKITLQLSYSASDPAKVGVFGTQATGLQYIPAPGHLRVWTKPATETRNPTSILNGGDWVLPNVQISLDKLPAATQGKLTLYIESVGLGQQTGDQVVKANLIKN
jgi:hypothetical protein